MQLVPFGLKGADNVDIAVNLNVGWSCVPLSLHWFLWSHFGEVGDHVLAFGYFDDTLVVHDDVESRLVDTYRSKNFSWLDVTLCCNAIDEVLQSSLHQVDCAVIVVVRLPVGNSRLNVEAGDYR